MNSKVTISQDAIRLNYYRYRGFIMPSVVLLVCLALFSQVILPQIKNFLEVQGQIATSKTKIDALNADVVNLSSLDEGQLDSNLQLATSALPPDRNLLSILAALNQAGVDAGVAINDYALLGGQGGSSGSDAQSLDVTVNITGSLDRVQKFITDIGNRLPLSRVTDLKTSANSAAISLSFYYKPFQNITFNDKEAIPSLSGTEQNVLTALASFKKGDTTLTDLGLQVGSQ